MKIKKRCKIVDTQVDIWKTVLVNLGLAFYGNGETSGK